MHKIALTLAVFGLSATAAFAQTGTTFAQLDTDTSGELSFAELQVAWPDLSQDEFTAADADLSGGVSTTEVAAVQPAAAAVPNAEIQSAPTDALAPAAPALDDNPQSLGTN